MPKKQWVGQSTYEMHKTSIRLSDPSFFDILDVSKLVILAVLTCSELWQYILIYLPYKIDKG